MGLVKFSLIPFHRLWWLWCVGGKIRRPDHSIPKYLLSRDTYLGTYPLYVCVCLHATTIETTTIHVHCSGVPV